MENTTEQIVESLSYWHSTDLDKIFDEILLVDVGKISILGNRSKFIEFQDLIVKKRNLTNLQ